MPGPSAPGGLAPGAPGAGPAAGSCGIFDLNACVDGFFRWLVGSALNPLLDLVSTTLLTTPTIESLPRVAQLWDTSWQVLLGCYALLILIAGVVVMAYETLQTRYTIKEIAPRLVVGFLAGALSLWVAARGIDIANGLAAAIAGDDLDPTSAGATLRAITQQSLTGGILILLMGLVLAVMLVVLLLTYVVRVAVTVVLVAGAPLALMFHALPHTEGIAKWWWKAFAAVLAIQVGQSLALITALKVFLAPAGFTPFGTVTHNGLVNILVAIALVYVMVKIPFWMLSTIRGGGGGSLVGSLVRGFVAYKSFGILGGDRSGHRGGGGTGHGRSARADRQGGGDGGNAESDDPYSRVRATRDGQYLLPLAGLNRAPRPAPGAPMPPTPRRPRTDAGRQLMFPLDGEWPEDKPVLGRDGQYRLPLELQRQPRPAPSPPPPPRPHRTGPRPVQTQLPVPGFATGSRSTGGAVAWLDAAGQYSLPLDVRRVPPPPAAPPPVSPRPPTPPTGPRPRQLHLPLDLPVRPRKPPTKPPPPTPPAAPPATPPPVPRRRPGKRRS